jgi:hypothetical protein
VATLVQVLLSLPIAETKVRAAPAACAGAAGSKQTKAVQSNVSTKAILVIAEALFCLT